MTKKGIITLIACGMIYLFTSIGFYIFTIPFLVGCIGGKKVREFYFNFIFGSWN